jgi:hypothetical protein
MPPKLSKERTLSTKEKTVIAAAQTRWMPTLYPVYSTPLIDLLASPLKYTLLRAVPVLAITGLYLWYITRGGQGPNSSLAMLLSVVGVFALIFLAGMYVQQYRRNNNIKDMLRRLPRGATYYDYLQSPVVQGDMNRRALSSGSTAVAAGSGGLLGGMWGSGRRGGRR